MPIIHDPLASINSKISFYAGENPATLTFYWINTPGVLILIAGFIGGLIQGASVGEIFGVLGTTVKNNVKTIITICSVLSVAKIMGYSGMISDIAKVLVAVAGDKFPLISPRNVYYCSLRPASGRDSQSDRCKPDMACSCKPHGSRNRKDDLPAEYRDRYCRLRPDRS